MGRDGSICGRSSWSDWQEEIVAKYPEQLLRGLFHSDGCRIVNWTSKPGTDKRYVYIAVHLPQQVG